MPAVGGCIRGKLGVPILLLHPVRSLLRSARPLALVLWHLLNLYLLLTYRASLRVLRIQCSSARDRQCPEYRLR